MRQAVECIAVIALSLLFSGCALVGHYSRPASDGSTHVTVGLISIEAISDGYPMLPLYNSFEAAK
jgi:hypothetical protein